MTRAFIVVVLLLAACKDSKDSKTSRGPELRPTVATQLKSIAPECEVKAAQGSRGTKELWLCKGPQATMTLHLDDKRHLIEVELGVFAASYDEANILITQTVRGIVSDEAVTAISERIKNKKSDPIVIDGVRVNAFHTQEPNQNPRFTAVLAW